MTRRTITAALAVLALALTLAAAVPPPAAAVSFVDKQVQAGSLLIQKYIDAYGQARQFTYPAKTVVKKGGGLDAPIWPANPWTGKIMSPGTSRGTYTYTLGAGGTSYKLTAHLSKGSYILRGGMPKWFKGERDTAARQDLLLLQRYVETYAASHGGVYPAVADVTPAGLGSGFVWPKNPWTGADMVAGDALGDFRYGGGGASYTLRVRLTTGWSATFGPVSVLGRLTDSAGG